MHNNQPGYSNPAGRHFQTYSCNNFAFCICHNRVSPMMMLTRVHRLLTSSQTKTHLARHSVFVPPLYRLCCTASWVVYKSKFRDVRLYCIVSRRNRPITTFMRSNDDCSIAAYVRCCIKIGIEGRNPNIGVLRHWGTSCTALRDSVTAASRIFSHTVIANQCVQQNDPVRRI